MKKYIQALHAAIDGISDLSKASDLLRGAIRAELPIYVCGNGGSASMADHFVIDMMKMAGAHNITSLSSNNAVITAWGNDVSYNDIFGAQLLRLKHKSILVAISSSGRSENVLRAARIVRTNNGEVIGISRKGGVRDGETYNPLLTIATYPISIPSDDTQILEDVTGTVLHMLARIVRDGNYD